MYRSAQHAAFDEGTADESVTSPLKGTMLVCAALVTMLSFSSPAYASCERQHRVSDGRSDCFSSRKWTSGSWIQKRDNIRVTQHCAGFGTIVVKIDVSGGRDFTPTLPDQNGGYWQGSVEHPERIRAAYACNDLSETCTKRATPQVCRRAYERNAELNRRCWSEKFAATGETCILEARCNDTYEPIETREYQRIARHLFDFTAIGLCPDGTLTDRAQCTCSVRTPGSKPTCQGTGELL